MHLRGSQPGVAMFKLPNGVYIPGDIILRDASAKIWQLLQTSKEFQDAPLYWSLQDVLGGNKCHGLSEPVKINLMSWLQLWKSYKFLVLAVGKLSDDLLMNRNDEIEATHHQSWQLRVNNLMRKNDLMRKLWGVGTLDSNDAMARPLLGGVLIDKELLSELLDMARDVYPARIETAEGRFEGEPTLKIVANTGGEGELGEELWCSDCKLKSKPLLSRLERQF